MEVLENQYNAIYERGIRTILPLGDTAINQMATGYGIKHGNSDPIERQEVDIEEPHETNGFGD